MSDYPKCSEPDCDAPGRFDGKCFIHHLREIQLMQAARTRLAPLQRICTTPGCDRPVLVGHTMCPRCLARGK